VALLSRKIGEAKEIEGPDARSLSDVMFGRYMLPNQTEFSCQIMDLSPEQGTFSCDDCPMMGEHIIAYIAEIGRVEGTVTLTGGTSFTVNFDIPDIKRDKIAKKISWMRHRDEHGLPEQRRHPRHEPRDAKTVLTLSDGRKYNCEIIDISVSGAAIKTPIIPSIGTQVMLGKTQGTVMRVLSSGVGIQFTKMLDQPALEEQIN